MTRKLLQLATAAALALGLFGGPAHAAYEAPENLLCVETSTTGTGTLSLTDAAATGYLPFTGNITSGATVNYTIATSDGEFASGTGVYTDTTTDTLTRTNEDSTDGANTLLTINAGTHTVCVGPNVDAFFNAGLGELDIQSLSTDQETYQTEQSAAAGDTAGEGQWWTRNDTPNTPMFTNDAGTDFQLNLGPYSRKITKFTSSGTFTADANMVDATVECQAAGGGGGGSDSTGTRMGGGGGGGGQYARIQYNPTEMGATASVTIGAVGAAGDTSGGSGGAATDTTFNPVGTGSTLTADGGGAGVGTGASSTLTYITRNTGGSGGSTGAVGDVIVPGGDGTTPMGVITGTSVKEYVCAGYGGGSFFAGFLKPPCGDETTFTDATGTTGKSYGGGGTGGLDNDTTGSGGGAGGPGICVVEELLDG